MRLFRFFFGLLSVLLIHFTINAQDKIYLSKGAILCHVIDITPINVSYLPLERSKAFTKYVNEVIILFNEKGTFLIPSKIDFSLAKSKELIKKFLQNEANNLLYDRIYKDDNKVIECTINNEDKNFILLAGGTKIDKKAVVAIIYKTGKHEIFDPINRAADILWYSFENNVKANRLANDVAKKDTSLNKQENVLEIPKISNQVFEKKLVNERVHETSKLPGTIADSNNTGKQVKKESNAGLKQTVVRAETAASPFTYDKDLFKKKADDKIKQFTTYLKIILDKIAEDEKVNKSMDQCFSLFVNADARVEVSSLNKAPVSRKIREYLTHIKLVQYDKIEVVWRNVSFVTDIHKAPDGNYYGNITFEQEFKGYKDGIQTYSDVTIKKADVILKTYEKIADGKTETLWDVLLGDIGVESTRSL